MNLFDYFMMSFQAGLIFLKLCGLISFGWLIVLIPLIAVFVLVVVSFTLRKLDR
jgi:heme exporter protein D